MTEQDEALARALAQVLAGRQGPFQITDRTRGVVQLEQVRASGWYVVCPSRAVAERALALLQEGAAWE